MNQPDPEEIERRFIPDAKWNYEPASAERTEVMVPEWREGDPPLAWWKPLIGVTVKAVLVRYYDQRHLLFDGDGSATNKVTHGGGPDMPSKSLPMRCWRAWTPVTDARAALEAAAALRQPREGAGEVESISDLDLRDVRACVESGNADVVNDEFWLGLLARLDSAEAALVESREQYAKLAEHHRQCEMAGTELCEAAKRWLSETGPGLKVNTMVGRQRTSTAVKTWDAHQWPEAEVDRA